MNIKSLSLPFSFIYDFLMDLVFPPRCIICDKLYAKTSFNDNIFVCDECAKAIRYTNKFLSQCKKCSRPISADKLICDVCQVVGHRYNVAFSCLLYKKSVRTSLLSYKFSGHRYKYRTYAKIMFEKYKEELSLIDFDYVVSVPISKSRRKRRGFDHVLPLAKYIARKSGIKYKKNAVLKIKDTAPQSKLTFDERFISVKGAYKANDEINFKGKRILLIDDIYTTGATVDEVSKVLKRKGAEFVAVLTLCITPTVER